MWVVGSPRCDGRSSSPRPWPRCSWAGTSASAAPGDLRIGSPQAFETPNPFKAVAGDRGRVLRDDVLRPARRHQAERPERRTTAPRSRGASTPPRTARRSRSTCARACTGRTASRSRAPTRCGRSTPCSTNKTNQLHGTIEAVKSVSAPDADTFVLHLATRDSEFLAKLAIPILPAHVWSKIPTNRLDKVDGPIPTVTTAPYALTKWEKNGTTILTRNEKYDVDRNGGKLPEVKRILITYYANPDSIYRDVNQGNLDYGYSGPASWAARVEAGREPEGRSSSPRRAAATGRSRSTRARPRARRSAAARARASRRGRPGSRDPQGAGLRDRPREADPDGLRRSGRHRLRPHLAALQAVLHRPQGHARSATPSTRRRRRPTLKAGGWNCAQTPCTKNGVKAQFELIDAGLEHAVPAHGAARQGGRAPRSASSSTSRSSRTTADQQPHLRERQRRRISTGPTFDAFLWDWDVSGTTPTPIMEVLLSNNASSDSFYDSKAYDKALLGARTATRPRQARRGRAQGRGGRARRPAVPPARPPQRGRARAHRHLARLEAVARAPTAGRCFEAAQQILALKAGPEPARAARRTAAAVAADGRRRLADDAALRADRLGADLARDPRLRRSSAERGRNEPLEWTEE